MCERERTHQVTGIVSAGAQGSGKPANYCLAWFFPSTGTKRFGANDFWDWEGVRAWKRTKFCGCSLAHIPEREFSVLIVFFAVLRKDKEQCYLESSPGSWLVSPSPHQDLGYWKEGSRTAPLNQGVHSALATWIITLCSHMYTGKCVQGGEECAPVYQCLTKTDLRLWEEILQG